MATATAGMAETVAAAAVEKAAWEVGGPTAEEVATEDAGDVDREDGREEGREPGRDEGRDEGRDPGRDSRNSRPTPGDEDRECRPFSLSVPTPFTEAADEEEDPRLSVAR